MLLYAFDLIELDGDDLRRDPLAYNELERAEQAREAIADLNPLFAEFNARQSLRTISRLSWRPLN